MRILMCNSFYYLRGGAERCFFDLTALLEANGHTVIPFSMAHPKNLPSPYEKHFLSYVDFAEQLQQEGGVKAKLRVAERVIYSREAKRKIAHLIAETKPDIAHIHGIAHETSPSILDAIKRSGMPIVQTLHDYKLVCPNTTFVSHGQVCEACDGWRYYNVARKRCKRGSLGASMLASIEAYSHKIMQIYEKNVDTFIAPSQFLRDKVKEHGVRTEVLHLPNFVHVDSFTPCDEAENYFVYVGRLVDVKGIRTLVEAMRTVGGAKLYIAGGGELENELRAEIAANQLEHVKLLGHLDKEELIALVQKAKGTIIPSEWYENCPMSVLESFACGTPVIGAQIGGIPELVQQEQTGLLFEPGNVAQLAQAMQYAIAHPTEMQEMGRQARRQVERHYSPTVHYEQTLQLYQSLLDSSH